MGRLKNAVFLNAKCEMRNVAQTVGDGALDVPPIEMRN